MDGEVKYLSDYGDWWVCEESLCLVLTGVCGLLWMNERMNEWMHTGQSPVTTFSNYSLFLGLLSIFCAKYLGRVSSNAHLCLIH